MTITVEKLRRMTPVDIGKLRDAQLKPSERERLQEELSQRWSDAGDVFLRAMWGLTT